MKKMAWKTRRQLLAKKVEQAKKRVDKANSLKDPLAELKSFHEYMTKDNEIIKLFCTRASEADAECVSWIFDLMERNMRSLYERSKWGWDAVAKQKELTEPQVWYLVASSNDKYLGFSHFRFDIDDKRDVLYCYELQLEAFGRRKGLGRFMMEALESMASQNKMQRVVLTVLKHNPSALEFFDALGYKLDRTSPPASYQMDYVILSKSTQSIDSNEAAEGRSGAV